MSKDLVVLVNPNKVFPPIAPYALDVLTTSLENAGFAVEVVDLTFGRDEWQLVLRDYFTGRDPLLVGVTVRNTDTVYAFEQRPFVNEHKEIIDEIKQLTGAPLVTGGIGFSTMPFALLDYFDVEYGVKGPGELILTQLADALRAGRDPRDIPGLMVNHGGGRVVRNPPAQLLAGRDNGATIQLGGQFESRAWQAETTSSYRRHAEVPFRVDNLAYYRGGGLGSILTKNGCVYRCTHCVEPDAKGTRFARRDVASVVDEMEMLTDHGIYDLHTTDSEFNLAINNSKRLLREIVARKNRDHSTSLHRLRLWVYCQPAPFDQEFAELLAAAGCAGVNVGADHVRADLLGRWKVTDRGGAYYTFADTQRLVELCHANGMMTMVEALFGMPGETLESMADCIDRFMALDATVTGFSLGLRLFPYIDLGRELAEECDGVRTAAGLQSNTATGPIVLKPLEKCSGPVEYERQFMFDENGDFRLVCYFSPELPEDEETVNSPTGRWYRSLQFLWDYIPESELYRVMLPTAAGISTYDNNYADNPFLTSLVGLGYTGAFWAHWRDRETIMAVAKDNGLLADVPV
ncbi:tryptophan 2-C-methyltransferase [Amycolatopsis sp. 195334CR]|uniref:tryptophan 2-C-methyltransferase n=1 Tax=Amycolatopsis sp. 195334CR TaxID=2814588 RepID=UPI001A8E1386|nr:tryptophan 2-C-methyltransferase [Amycolatopsis sp. 195334CR]MBN6039744.1 tryptophan 2-C-methyltransferase [Amycolatopsis sp. 195334CR]